MIAYKPFRNLRIAGQFLGLIYLSLFVSLLNAQIKEDEPNPQPSEEIYVTAKLPGPALWQVSSGENTLYIFGSLQPLPKDFDWDSGRVDWVISQSQEFIDQPGVYVHSVNPLRMLQLNRLKKLPDNQELADVIPPALFDNYLEVKELYAPRNRNLNEMRPFFAAEQLFRAALTEVGLTNQVILPQELIKIAKKHRVPVTETRVRLPVDIALDTLKQTPMALEIECLETSLASIEADLQSNIARARTWANGNVTALRQFDSSGIQQACFGAALAVGDEYQEAERQTREQWINAASQALETNESTFAVLRTGELLNTEGLLSELRNLGYDVKETR